MTAALTIEEFHTLLTSERETSPLLEALRQLMSIAEPAEIVAVHKAAPAQIWGWS